MIDKKWVTFLKFPVMRTKVFENQFFFGLFLLVAVVVVLINTKLVASPVRISEKGLFLYLAAAGLFYAAVRIIAKSIHRA